MSVNSYENEWCGRKSLQEKIIDDFFLASVRTPDANSQVFVCGRENENSKKSFRFMSEMETFFSSVIRADFLCSIAHTKSSLDDKLRNF